MEDAERRHKSFWDKWQTIILLGGMLSGFMAEGLLYAFNEGKKEQKIDYLVLQVADFAVNRYTKDDAAKDQAVNTAHYEDIGGRLKELEYRANRTEQAYPNRQSYPTVHPSPMPRLVP